MAGPKKGLPAPIDRPLSRAYLREFSGWSTAYPPGLSEPTSLRVMENVDITRDGAARVRPGLRYLSWQLPPELAGGSILGLQYPIVGSHEAFYLNDGSKAYLLAYRLVTGYVRFVLWVAEGPYAGQLSLDHPEIGFSVPQGMDVLDLSPATTYVKYLQIDNKIFALADGDQEMRMFEVGGTKIARKLSSIERPDWTVADKLTVVHPVHTWINSAISSDRTNLLKNPSFETNMSNWSTSSKGKTVRTDDVPAQNGVMSARIESLPERTNRVTNPLRDPVTNGFAGWTSGGSLTAATVNGSPALRVDMTDPFEGNMAETTVSVTAGAVYSLTVDLIGKSSSVSTFAMEVDWLDSSGDSLGIIEGSISSVSGPSTEGANFGPAPAGATSARVRMGRGEAPGAGAWYAIGKVLFALESEASSFFDGASGANYFWTGAAHASISVYHPPQTVTLTSHKFATVANTDYAFSIYQRADSTARTITATFRWLKPDGTAAGTPDSDTLADAAGSWNRNDVIGSYTSSTMTQAQIEISVPSVARGEYHYFDSALLEKSSSVGTYFDGSLADTSTLIYEWNGTAHGSTSRFRTMAAPVAAPTAATPAADTLISSEAADNDYNVGFFYTFTNEIGESAASQVTVVRIKRKWTGWSWKPPKTSAAPGEPDNTQPDVFDPILCADQLVAIMPQEVFTEAQLQGATAWNLYMVTWSDQDAVPVTAALLGTQKIAADSLYGSAGWQRMTPVTASVGNTSLPLPTANNRYNYSDPSHGRQGIVAADRMVIVNDPSDAAVIRWTSNQQGYYQDFTSRLGGGFKTLTSGNLQIPACVKLWQNPQSADTLTILTLGTDGHSTGYYMAPAQVASQSEAVNIMAFEETTATPGTTSPFGCEVLNNALYHPLDDVLMKSTASNYNINHKEVTEQIRNKWVALQSKIDIVSSQLDNRIYLIVNNPEGLPLEAGCKGNEIWVYDAGSEAGVWSRWLVQASSLRKIERNGRIYMSVVHPTGIYYFDPEYGLDDWVGFSGGIIATRPIPWKLETNTQGANRAHDAWAHLQQLTINVGNFQGTMRYGVRGFDLHGKPIHKEKLLRDLEAPDLSLPWDLEDHLKVQRDMKEWFFFASSVEDEGQTLQSSGQISLVQYRYTPISVNVGYEYGSVETFEYSRFAARPTDPGFTTNGTPQPMIDTRRP